MRRKEETADWDKLGGQRSHGGKSGDQNERKGGTKNGQSSNGVWKRRQEAAEVKRLSFSVEVDGLDQVNHPLDIVEIKLQMVCRRKRS